MVSFACLVSNASSISMARLTGARLPAERAVGSRCKVRIILVRVVIGFDDAGKKERPRSVVLRSRRSRATQMFPKQTPPTTEPALASRQVL